MTIAINTFSIFLFFLGASVIKRLNKDKVSKEAPSTADLGLDLWKADPNDPSKLEIMGEKAWNSAVTVYFLVDADFPLAPPFTANLFDQKSLFAGGARPGEIHAGDSGQDGPHSGHDGVFAG